MTSTRATASRRHVLFAGYISNIFIHGPASLPVSTCPI